MTVSQIRLRNFRGFRDTAIDLKPLTVLLGPNSAGKSSFGHALAAMAHAHRVYATGPQASLTPPIPDVEKWPVDLGQTGDLRTQGSSGPVRVALLTDSGWVELGFGGLRDTQDLVLSHIIHPSGERSAQAGATTAKVVPRPEKQPPPIPVTRQLVLEDDPAAVQITRLNELQWQEGGVERSVILQGLLLKAVLHLTGTSGQLSKSAMDELALFLGGITYLRPNRKRPHRGYAAGSDAQQPIGYSGEWSPSVIHARREETVLHFQPPAIPRTPEQAKQLDRTWYRTTGKLSDALNAWLAHLDIGTAVEAVKGPEPDRRIRLRVTLKNQAPRDITEIGFGVSQAIPIFTAGLLQPENSLFIVDLPEGHLHPRPQAAMADFFCSMVLAGRSVLVETHSEMLFHRLRVRAAMNPDLWEKMAVYFVHAPHDGICRDPEPVDLSDKGEVTWPEGFLHESWEAETQVMAVRQAYPR